VWVKYYNAPSKHDTVTDFAHIKYIKHDHKIYDTNLKSNLMAIWYKH
jgi:hypothetical protein